MSVLHAYIELIRSAVQGQIALPEFGTLFMDRFAAESQCFPEPAFDILNSIFLDSDEFEPDPKLFAELKKSAPGFVIDATEYSHRLSTNLERLVRYA